MTESSYVNSEFYNSTTDMNETTQFQKTVHTNYEMEIQIPESFHCGYVSDHLTIFLIGGIGMSLVSSFGIIGNILCAIVLSRPSMRTSTNIILFSLSVCDLLFVFVAFLVYGIPWSIQYFCVGSFESFYLTTLYPIMLTYCMPLAFIGQLGSTYFTVCVTVERFFVVYRPLMARPYCTNTNAIRVSLVVAAFAILFALPYWWHFKIESVYDENGSWTKYRILFSLINDTFDLYLPWLSMFVYRIIPAALLTLLNISIYWKIRKSNKMRESMTQQVTSSEISLAKMLIWVVSIFLVCNLCDLYRMLAFWVGLRDTPELLAVGIFFFNLNSAVNFIIYTFKSQKFRLMFLELFWPKKLRGRSSNNAPRCAQEVGSPTNATTKV